MSHVLNRLIDSDSRVPDKRDDVICPNNHKCRESSARVLQHVKEGNDEQECCHYLLSSAGTVCWTFLTTQHAALNNVRPYVHDGTDNGKPLYIVQYTVVPLLTSDPANEFFG